MLSGVARKGDDFPLAYNRLPFTWPGNFWDGNFPGYRLERSRWRGGRYA